MKIALTSLAAIISFICCYSQSLYPLIIENDNNYTVSHVFPGPIISPSVPTAPLAVDGSTPVRWESDSRIHLKPGFSTSASGSGYFLARINALPINVVLIDPVPTNPEEIVRVSKWEKLEIGIELPQEYTTAIQNFLTHYYDAIPGNIDTDADLNPYADDSLIVEMHLTSPSGLQKTKYGFYCRPGAWSSTTTNGYMIEGTNDPLYPYKIRFRFAPDEVGLWSFYFTISAPDITQPLPLISYQFNDFQFYCDPPLSDNHGYLKINSATNNRYLKFDDNTPFFGFGENLMISEIANPFPFQPYSRAPYYGDYQRYVTALQQLNSAGANYIRTFLLAQNFAPEWDNLGVYDQHEQNDVTTYCVDNSFGFSQWSPQYRGNRQYNCWLLDEAFKQLRANDIYMQMCIDPYPPIGAYQTFIWGNNAYAKYLDNVSTLPAQKRSDTYAYFNDPTLRYYWKRKYK